MDLICPHLLIMAVMWSASAAPSYTTICNQEIGCEAGFYCETDLTCKPCLRCQDLKREPLPISTACLTSRLECGTCIYGFKEDLTTSECITPTEQGFPTWSIAFVMGSLLLFALICAIAAYILRNLVYLKIFSSMTIRTTCDNHIEEVNAPPPTYDFVAFMPKTQPVGELQPFMQAVQNKFSCHRHEPLERPTTRVFRDPGYFRNPQVGSIQELMRVREATVQHCIVPHTVQVGQVNMIIDIQHTPNSQLKLPNFSTAQVRRFPQNGISYFALND